MNIAKPLVTVAVVLFALIGKAQEHDIKYDTLAEFSDKILVEYRWLDGSRLSETGQAFLYRINLEQHNEMDSMVLHGTVKHFKSDSTYRVGFYQDGIRISMEYFDSSGREITWSEFYQNLRSQADPERGNDILLIEGTKPRTEK